MDRQSKENLVASLRWLFENTTTVVVTHYSGLAVSEMEDLRGRMYEAGASFKVTKNRLTRLALEGTKFQELGGLFAGPTAIACSKDPVAAAKVCVNFAKGNDKLVVLGGGMGEEVYDASGVKALAALPSLDELRAGIVGMLSTPATRVAGVLQAPASQVVRVISAHSEQGEAA